MSLIVIFFFAILCFCYGELQFCQICFCELDYSNYYDVICHINDVTSVIFDESYWIDGKTKKTYPYRSLSVKNNAIRGLDVEFPKSSVKILILEECSISNVGGSVFSNLEFLEKLVLSHNEIESLHPKAFVGKYKKNGYQFLHIKTLLIDHNKLESLHRSIFNYCDEIEVLNLSHNPFQKLNQQTTKALDSLKFLKKLDLSHTQLSFLSSSFLKNNKNVRYLDLSGNNFNHVPSPLTNLQKLRVLRFSNNILSFEDGQGFPNITSLKTLHLSNMPNLRRIGKGTFAQLSQLEELDLSNNTQLSDIDKDAFLTVNKHKWFWPPVLRLYLQNNKLSSLDMELLEWDNLEEIKLSGNPWVCQCGNRWMIEDLLPNVLYRLDNNGTEQLVCSNFGTEFNEVFRNRMLESSCWTFHIKTKHFIYECWKKMSVISFTYVNGVLTVGTIIAFYFFKKKN